MNLYLNIILISMEVTHFKYIFMLLRKKNILLYEGVFGSFLV